MLHVPERPIGALTTLVLDRLTLTVNHVLAAEPQAVARLQPHAGKTVDARAMLALMVPTWAWPADAVQRPVSWRVTPAGLLERVDAKDDSLQAADAVLGVRTESLTVVLRALAKGDASVLDVQGEPALTEDVMWVATHVRWDYARDIERVLPTAVGAHAARAAERAAEGLGRGVRAVEAWWSKSQAPR